MILSLYRISLIILIFILGICTSFTDILKKKIYNKTLILFSVLGLIIQVIYFVSITSNQMFSYKLHQYVINTVLTLIVSFVMYYYNVWAAGDAKLFMALMLAFPQDYRVNNMNTFFMTLIFIFSTAFIYVVIDSLLHLYKNYMDKKPSIKPVLHYDKENIKVFLSRYIFSYLVVFVFNQYVTQNFEMNQLYKMILNLVLITSFFKVVKQVRIMNILSVIIIVLLILKFYFFGLYNGLNFNIKISYLILIFGILVLRSIASKYNYKSIKVQDLKEGMVLSFSSTILFRGSRVKGLPQYTSENTRTRLTKEEVKSIIRWSNSSKGHEDLTIVRLLPFAPFIFIGTLIVILITVIS
ncbi:MAG: prepilin peptidase [Halanaerobiales bacterium]|nr:prepilin peptidase [Halanaerobiales bacterium]